MLVASVQAPLIQLHVTIIGTSWPWAPQNPQACAEGLVCMPYLCQQETSMSLRTHWCWERYQETCPHTGLAADNWA